MLKLIPNAAEFECLQGTSVQPDSVYWARSRIICDDTALDGNYTYSNSAITFPACDFSTHSGLEDSFECQDCIEEASCVRVKAALPWLLLDSCPV
eukprot:6421971-Amphidinium_carterae.2